MRAKKTAVIMLLSIALLGLCACGGSQTDPAPAAEPAAEATEAPLTEADVLGTVEGNVYTNTFIGVGCRLGDEWTYLDADQLYELGGVVADTLSEDLSKAMEDGKVLYAMYATAEGGMRTVCITLEKLNAITSITLDESGYIDLAVDQTVSAMEAQGATISSCEHIKVNFAGEERACMHVEGEVSGILLYQNAIPIKCGSYMAVCTVSGFGENTLEEQESTLEEMGAAFYALQ